MTYKSSFTHGLMFHHFHDRVVHPSSQGSITENDFYNLINFVGLANILSADDYIYRFENSELKPTDTCLTFDDALLCQFDVALPVMEELDIKGFWFIYSSPFFGRPDSLEMFRFFRSQYFSHIDEFYSAFFRKLEHGVKAIKLETFFEQKNTRYKELRKLYPFYSSHDVRFRLVRDELLTKDQYVEIMSEMMAEGKFNEKEAIRNMYLTDGHLKDLVNNNHLLGLHSYEHYTNIGTLGFEVQSSEYKRNFEHLKEVTEKNIKVMSHPSSSYNEDTKIILEKLGITLGFRDNMLLDNGMEKINASKFEIAREDHANIIKMMRK